MVSKTYFHEEPWKNKFPRDSTTILKWKKSKSNTEIIGALGLLGPSTTTEIARFVLSVTKTGEYVHIRGRDVSIREGMYHKLIYGRIKPTKKKSAERYPGLKSERFVGITKKEFNSKKIKIPKYFLTLKGCFFAMGFDFSDFGLENFLKGSSRNHLFFAYIYKIMQSTSVKLVRILFFEPIQNMIVRGRITLDDDISFYFSNFTEAISRRLMEFMEEYHMESKQIGSLMKCTFYDENVSSDWQQTMIEYFFPESDAMDFYMDYSDPLDAALLFQSMKAIHFGYHHSIGLGIPKRTQKIPYSKEWREHKKFYPQYKSPYDYDRKRNIRINH